MGGLPTPRPCCFSAGWCGNGNYMHNYVPEYLDRYHDAQSISYKSIQPIAAPPGRVRGREVQPGNSMLPTWSVLRNCTEPPPPPSTRVDEPDCFDRSVI